MPGACVFYQWIKRRRSKEDNVFCCRWNWLNLIFTPPALHCNAKRRGYGGKGGSHCGCASWWSNVKTVKEQTFHKRSTNVPTSNRNETKTSENLPHRMRSFLFGPGMQILDQIETICSQQDKFLGKEELKPLPSTAKITWFFFFLFPASPWTVTLHSDYAVIYNYRCKMNAILPPPLLSIAIFRWNNGAHLWKKDT